jgi:hypothetical protein
LQNYLGKVILLARANQPAITQFKKIQLNDIKMVTIYANMILHTYDFKVERNRIMLFGLVIL